MGYLIYSINKGIIMNLANLTVTQLQTNQIIVAYGTIRAFYSYGTFIASIENGSVVLGPKWKYSSTTSKYRNQFLDETTAETQAKLDDGIYKEL